MSKSKSIVPEVILDRMKNKNAWCRLIQETESEIETAQARLRSLRRSVLIFQKQMESGEAFPGERKQQS